MQENLDAWFERGIGMAVYVNVAVEDVARSRAFFTALGFSFDERFSNDMALGMIIDGGGYAMLLRKDFFQSFTTRELADPRKACEVMIAVQLGSREAVAEMHRVAMANGGGELGAASDLGFMFSHDFADPDGHIWSPFWMDPAQMTEQA
jgi:predicted lactoylglutathione lyase